MLQWWRIHWGRAKHWRWQADRPYRLIAFAVLPLVIVAIAERLLDNGDLKWLRDWIKESSLYGPLFFPGEEAIVWKDRLQGVILLLGLPVAFCLWYWRDRNVRDQIENSRKDINLKEFQEVQMRAAGAMDENLPEAARRQLQIADRLLNCCWPVMLPPWRRSVRMRLGPYFITKSLTILKKSSRNCKANSPRLRVKEWQLSAMK